MAYRTKVIPLNEKTENKPIDKELIIDIEHGHISVYKQSESKLLSATKRIESELMKAKIFDDIIKEQFTETFNQFLKDDNQNIYEFDFTNSTDPDKENKIDFKVSNINKRYKKIKETYEKSISEINRLSLLISQNDLDSIPNTTNFKYNNPDILDSIKTSFNSYIAQIYSILKYCEEFYRYVEDEKGNLVKINKTNETILNYNKVNTIDSVNDLLSNFNNFSGSKRTVGNIIQYLVVYNYLVETLIKKYDSFKELLENTIKVLDKKADISDYRGYMSDLKDSYEKNVKNNSYVASGNYTFTGTYNGEYDIDFINK